MPPSELENKIMNIPIGSDFSSSAQFIQTSEITIESEQRKTVTGRNTSVDSMFNSRTYVVSNGTVTTVTSATETNLELIDLTGISWNVGKVIRLTARGVYTNTDGVTTVTFRVGIGTAPTTEWNSMISTAGAVTNQPWQLTWTGVITALGTSGALEAQMIGQINNVNKDDPNTATVTFDTTTVRLLALTAQWSGTDAGNTASVRQIILEILN